MNTRESKGTIETIKENPPHEFTKVGTKAYIYSIGIKLEGDEEWHNISSFENQEACKKVLNKLDGGVFVEGDTVALTEEEYRPGKFNIKGISADHTTEEVVVQTNKEIGADIGQQTEVVNENVIEKQCCLKCACMVGGMVTKEDCLKTAQWFYSKLGEKWLQ